MVIQFLRTLQLRACKGFIGDSLAVIGEAAGNIVAANAQQYLPLLNGVNRA
jgi:hypothetical protein